MEPKSREMKEKDGFVVQDCNLLKKVTIRSRARGEGGYHSSIVAAG
jgi:hypothetical protein